MYQRPLVAVPSNVGPATIPDYPALAAQGVFDLGNGVRVFVGQREETFYIDLGSTFDSLNFREHRQSLTLTKTKTIPRTLSAWTTALRGLT